MIEQQGNYFFTQAQVSLDSFPPPPFTQILLQHCTWSEIGVSNGTFLKNLIIYLYWLIDWYTLFVLRGIVLNLFIFIIVFANSTAVKSCVLLLLLLLLSIFMILGIIAGLSFNPTPCILYPNYPDILEPKHNP